MVDSTRIASIHSVYDAFTNRTIPACATGRCHPGERMPARVDLMCVGSNRGGKEVRAIRFRTLLSPHVSCLFLNSLVQEASMRRNLSRRIFCQARLWLALALTVPIL